MENYIVYCYTSPSNKKYIGQTNKDIKYRANHGKGYIGCPAFYCAIQKYGWDWFEHHCEILAKNLTKKEADELEQFYIKKFDSIKNGYNIQSGGEFNPKEILSIPIVGINCITKELYFFDSAVKAGEFVGTSNKNITACLKRVNNGKTSKGYVWLYKADWDNMTQKQKEYYYSITPYNHDIKKKAVVCIETNIVYNSIKEAAEATGAQKSGIVNCCKGKQKTAKGLHWKYKESEE